MDRNTLKQLLIAASKGNGYDSFSTGEVDKAVQAGLKEYLGVSERGMRRLRAEDFEIIEEVIEELTPKAVEDIIGQFAEVRTFGRQEQVMFNIKQVGGARVMRAIVPGARAGIYKARRIDQSHMQMDTQVETVGYALSLEDLLTGRVTIQDYVSLVTQGFVEVIYQRMIEALRAGALTANGEAKAGALDDNVASLGAALDSVIRVVAAYGTPTIFAFETAASLISNQPGTTGFITDQNDIRDYGYVTKYKGRSVVVLPNFLTDNSNSKWVFDEETIFVLPANEKPIKVAFAGDLHVQEVAIPSGGVEFHAHREVGVGVLMANAIGSITLHKGD